ncbi:hypothetical protein ACHAWX_005778 [Stephanocyclus meneghinianus]
MRSMPSSIVTLFVLFAVDLYRYEASPIPDKSPSASLQVYNSTLRKFGEAAGERRLRKGDKVLSKGGVLFSGSEMFEDHRRHQNKYQVNGRSYYVKIFPTPLLPDEIHSQQYERVVKRKRKSVQRSRKTNSTNKRNPHKIKYDWNRIFAFAQKNLWGNKQKH